ncbi:MAG TPA: sigma factor-like helix-turn-helix DNA-binding protein [Chthoniobacteraceae bacterium]|jgi:RNA polymerase sigma-70 factor (ECF subfamily)|nr:sigma factor-like helix-turn-helix DNA-binding protein [Chthoniobacteraceae bacterium]
MTSPADRFLTTRWTRVVAARGSTPEAQQALSELCAVNYAPVLRFLRASGHDPDEARELAHEFFAHVLQHKSLDGSDPARGRFRSYLLGALKHFAANRRAHGARLKRGAGLETVPPATGDETAHGPVPEALRTAAPEALFDREWALAVIERSLAALELENSAAGSAESFRKLKPWLSPSSEPPAQAEIAAQLGLSEGAVKVAIHRLRKRFRQLVRSEVAQTIDDERELDAEMRYLLEALSERP